MVNEVKQGENLPESPSGEHSSAEVAEAGQTMAETRVAELEQLLVKKSEELTRASSRLIELEQVIISKDSQMAALKQTGAGLAGSLAKAIASYKAMVVQANPEVVEELITGDSIEAISESLSKAKALASRVRQGVEAEISLARVPAGAPERTSLDLSALSPREKIKYAIGGLK